MIPEPEQVFVAQKIAVGLVGHPGDLGRLMGHERGRLGVVDLASLVVGLGELERLPAGAQRLEAALERLVKERDQPVECRDRRGADQQFARRCVPQERERLAAQVTAIARLVLQPFLGRQPGLALLPAAGQPAGVLSGECLQLDLGVSAQQIGGDLLLVDAQTELQDVVDDVTGCREYDRPRSNRPANRRPRQRVAGRWRSVRASPDVPARRCAAPCR